MSVTPTPATPAQIAEFTYHQRRRHGPWLVTCPSGPYDAAALQRFVDSLPATADYHAVVETTITGGSGVGYPGYYEERVLAFYQPAEVSS